MSPFNGFHLLFILLIGTVLVLVANVLRMRRIIQSFERVGRVRLEPTWGRQATMDLINHLRQTFVNADASLAVARETVRFVLKRLQLEDITRFEINSRLTQLRVDICELTQSRKRILSQMIDYNDLDIPVSQTPEQEARERRQLEELRKKELDLVSGIKRLQAIEQVWGR